MGQCGGIANLGQVRVTSAGLTHAPVVTWQGGWGCMSWAASVLLHMACHPPVG